MDDKVNPSVYPQEHYQSRSNTSIASLRTPLKTNGLRLAGLIFIKAWEAGSPGDPWGTHRKEVEKIHGFERGKESAKGG